jgi:hypothetical protein
MTYAGIEKSEPTLVAGLYSGGAGLLALLAANFSLPHSAGLAVGMAASQALLTRPGVWSPAAIEEMVNSSPSASVLPEILTKIAKSPRPDEPAATVGVFVFLAGFLVQMFSGVDMASALASAAGIAGVQTAATRSRVYSPVTTQALAALGLKPPGPPAAPAVGEPVS